MHQATCIEREDQEARQLESLRSHAHAFLPYLDRQEVTDVVVNPDGNLWVKERGKFERVGFMPAKVVLSMLHSVATIQQVKLNHEHPILGTIFPIDGSRLEGLISPVVARASFAIRKRASKVYSLRDYTESEILTGKSDPINEIRHRDLFLEKVTRTDSHKEVLELAILYRRNIVVVGSTGAGKTTFLNALIQAMSVLTPDDRLVIIEDTPELQCDVPNSLALLSSDRVSQVECLSASLRLNPTRILVGEVRWQASAKVLVSSWNTGHSGGLATVHANSAKEGLYRLDELIATASARSEVARAVNLVVFIDEEPSIAARRKVREILVVEGLDQSSGDYKCTQV